MWRQALNRLAKPSLLGFVLTMLVPAVLIFLLLIRVFSASHTLSKTSVGSLVGQPAPNLTVSLWNGSTTQSLQLSNLKGAPVVVNFWASWCHPCEQEAPVLESAYKSYAPRGVVFLGAAIGTNQTDGLAFLKGHNITYQCGAAPNQASVSYGVVAIPVTVLINSNGDVTRVFKGPVSASVFDAAVRSLLT